MYTCGSRYPLHGERKLLLESNFLFFVFTDDCCEINNDEALRRLDVLIQSIQSAVVTRGLTPQYSWWLVKANTAKKVPFKGYESCVTLSEQLDITDEELGVALVGQTSYPTETSLNSTRPGAFLFRRYGKAMCVAITKLGKNCSVWNADAVPCLENLVKKSSIQTKTMQSLVIKTKPKRGEIVTPSPAVSKKHNNNRTNNK